MTRHHGATPLNDLWRLAKWVTRNILRKFPQMVEVLWNFAATAPAKAASSGQGVTRFQGVGHRHDFPDAEDRQTGPQMHCQAPITRRHVGPAMVVLAEWRSSAIRESLRSATRPRGEGGRHPSRRRQREAAANRLPELRSVPRLFRATQCRDGPARNRWPSSERR